MTTSVAYTDLCCLVHPQVRVSWGVQVQPSLKAVSLHDSNQTSAILNFQLDPMNELRRNSQSDSTWLQKLNSHPPRCYQHTCDWKLRAAKRNGTWYTIKMASKSVTIWSNHGQTWSNIQIRMIQLNMCRKLSSWIARTVKPWSPAVFLDDGFLLGLYMFF